MATGMADLKPLSTVQIPSLEGKVGAEEWKIRVDLAAAYRLIAYYGWDDIIFTISRPEYRVPSITSCSIPII
jgi:hypothetical protein